MIRFLRGYCQGPEGYVVDCTGFFRNLLERGVARRRESSKKPVPLSDVLARVAWGKRGRNLVDLYHLQKNWPEIVGTQLAAQTLPKLAKRDVLVVAVENPAWAQHLTMMKPHILSTVAERTGQQYKDLRFVTESLAKIKSKVKTAVQSQKKLESAKSNLKNADEHLSTLLERIKRRALFPSRSAREGP